jgi:cytochrome c-type biogenesis protein CcmH
LLLVAAAVLRAQAPPAPTLEVIGNKVMCTCGCVAILNQCPHQGCSTHEEISGVIRKLIAEGKSEPEILDALTARYGKKILAAPRARGFDLTAWVLPGVGLIFGLLIVILMVRRWRRPRETAATPRAPVDPKALAAIEEEIKASGLGTRG